MNPFNSFIDIHVYSRVDIRIIDNAVVYRVGGRVYDHVWNRVYDRVYDCVWNRIYWDEEK